MEFLTHRCDNGLEIVAEVNPRAYSTSLGFFVNAGSRDESDDIAGVSHFLEHMAFKGTPRRSAADVNRELDEMGSVSNASTSEERTIYYAAMLPEFQDHAVDLLSDILRPSLRDDDFEMEKKVIIEEICMYDDQPPFGGNERCMAAYFGSHPLGRSILGTVESVQGLTADRMRLYFQQRYSPGNIALVAAGNVDFDALVATTERCCGNWQPFDAPRDLQPAERQASFHVLHKEQSMQEYVIQIAAGPSAEDDDRYAASILATILGDDSGSRFYWELVDPGRAEYASMVAYPFHGTGILMTFVGCAPEDTAENLQRVHDMHRMVEEEGIEKEELTRAQNKITAAIILQAERPANRMFAVGTNWLMRREYRTSQQAVAAYQAVTADDVAAVARKYRPSINTTMAVGPLKDIQPPVTGGTG